MARYAKEGYRISVVTLTDGAAGEILNPAMDRPGVLERLVEVRREELRALTPGPNRLFDCCVDLGSESVDTRSNAEEASRWLAKHRYRSFRLITSDYHMRRARYDFDEVLGDKYKIVPDAVRADSHFTTLFSEYNKYVLRRLAVLLGI